MLAQRDPRRGSSVMAIHFSGCGQPNAQARTPGLKRPGLIESACCRDDALQKRLTAVRVGNVQSLADPYRCCKQMQTLSWARFPGSPVRLEASSTLSAARRVFVDVKSK